MTDSQFIDGLTRIAFGGQRKYRRALPDKTTVAFFTHFNGMILGVERMFLDLVSNLSSSIRPVVFVLGDSETFSETLGCEDIPIYEVPVPLFPYTIADEQLKAVPSVYYLRHLRWLYQENYKQVPEALRILEHEKVDLAHTLTSVLPLGSLSAYKAGIPHIWHTGETIVNNGWQQRLWIRYMHLSSEAIVGVSKRTAREYGPETVVIHNGVQIHSILAEYSAAETKTLVSEYDIVSGDLVLSCVGTIQYTKGQVVLVKAVELLAKTRSDLSLKVLLVGPWSNVGINEEYYQELIRTIANAGLTDSVFLTGYRSDFIRFIKLADIVAHPVAAADSYPAAIRDAMLCGKPVIGTLSGGIPEMIEDGENGLLVPPNDVEGLSQAIELLADDPQLRGRLSQNAVSFAKENFDGSIMSAQIESLYKRVLCSLPIKD